MVYKIFGSACIAFLASHLRPGTKSTTTVRYAIMSSSSPLPRVLDIDGTTEMSSSDLSARLSNKRVALYFAAGWCPMCTSFEPSLLQFRQAAADSGSPLELVYVSSDRSPNDQAKRTSAMGMLSVVSTDATELKRLHKIWAGSETLKFGSGRRSGVPALVVLDKTGKETAFLAVESQGVKALQSWPLDDHDGVW